MRLRNHQKCNYYAPSFVSNSHLQHNFTVLIHSDNRMLHRLLSKMVECYMYSYIMGLTVGQYIGTVIGHLHGVGAVQHEDDLVLRDGVHLKLRVECQHAGLGRGQGNPVNVTMQYTALAL